MTWAGLEEARGLWSDAPLDDDLLGSYLESAHEQCVSYAPALPTPEEGQEQEVPERYVVAEVMQARAIYRSLRAGNQDQMGPDGFTVTVFPLDFNVKALLRPNRGKPVIA